jgi:hypothetical protein
VHSHNKKCWLWLPVFSDLPDLFQPEDAIGCDGKAQRSPADISGFRFACPSSPRNINIAYEMYMRDFSGLPFDGVFLDRIRHASFASGLADSFGCFCDSCKAAYAERGVDLDEISGLIHSNPAAMLPGSIENPAGVYGFENEAVGKFYKAKADIIEAAVIRLVKLFTEKGLEVALDVFAPTLAYLVGQNLPALAAHVTFIKPMFYRITDAPAGLPYELKWLKRSYLVHGKDTDGLLKHLWGTDDLLSDEIMEAQLKALAGKLRPGFEINCVPGICESDGDYVRGTAALISRSGADNAVLSWNLLSASGGNLEALSQNNAIMSHI